MTRVKQCLARCGDCGKQCGGVWLHSGEHQCPTHGTTPYNGFVLMGRKRNQT